MNRRMNQPGVEQQDELSDAAAATIASLRKIIVTSDSDVVLWIDFGGVICPGTGTATDEVAGLLGTTWVQMYAAADAFAGTLGTFGLGPLELGLIAQDAWIDEVLSRLGSSMRAADLPERFETVWYRGRDIDWPFYRALLELRAERVAVGVLTNSVAEWEGPRCRMVDLDADLDAVVRSHVIHRMKPDPEMFSYAEGVLGGPGVTHVLVDDLARNCQGARNVGWLAVHHADVKPLEVPGA